MDDLTSITMNLRDLTLALNSLKRLKLPNTEYVIKELQDRCAKQNEKYQKLILEVLE